MGSALLPIVLSVILVVGAVVFVALSSRAPYQGSDQPPPTGDGRGPARPAARRAERSRPPAPRLRVPRARRVPPEWEDDTPMGDPDSIVLPPVPVAADPVATPTPAVSAPEPAAPRASETAELLADEDAWDAPSPSPAGQARSENVTTQDPSDSGATWPGDDRDPDATGWAPPPRGNPHQAPSAPVRDTEADETRAAPPVVDDAWGPPAPPAASPVPQPAPPPPAPRSASPQPTAAPEPQPWAFSAPTDPPGVGAPQAATVTGTAPGPYVAAEPERFTAPPLRLAAAGRTRRGKRGGPNEDAFVVVDGLLAVADGVGGEAAGQIASTLAVTTVAGYRPQFSDDPREALREAVNRANRMVRERPKSEPAWRGMACTLDVVVLGRQAQTGRSITVAHVGDSTVWLQPGKGEPRQVTTPHAITGGPLLNAIGLADEIDMDLIQIEVNPGDRVVLSSDGMTKVMKTEQLYGLLHQLAGDPPDRAADALVEAAMLAGARDDTTVVVADIVAETSGR